MDAIQYNGRCGSIAENLYQWVRPEWCPVHGAGEAEEFEKACWCTRRVGDGKNEVPEKFARMYVKSRLFDAIEIIDLPEPDPED
jgi:hypothetical protein